MAGKGEGGSHPRMSAGYPAGSPQQGEEHKGWKESAQQMGSQLSETAEQVKEKARETVGQARDKAREYVSGVAGQAQETWRGAREGLQEGWSRVSDKAGDIWDDAANFVRRYPIASLAAAFGLGCLVSAALWAVPHYTSDDMTERMSRS
jgi:ElaB/YqjD/DUF883 family membrane-anchored ribosome-binding protein